MTAAERAFWLRAQRSASAMAPDVSRAYLRGLAALRDRMPISEVEQLVRAGSVEQVVSLVAGDAEFARAFAQYVREVRTGVERATNASARTISGGRFGGPPRTTRRARTAFPPPPPTTRTIEVGFDILNPKVIDAVRGMETRSLGTIREEVRDVVRAHVENGLRDGVNPRTTARELRDIIGLAPNQAQEVRNYRQALEDGRAGKALEYKARDRRYDDLLRRGERMTPEQIERAVAMYQKKRIALNAETHARTAALDAQRLGQRLGWQQSIDAGIFEGRRVLKRWVATLDDRVRPEHEEADGIEVEFDELFPVDGGVMTPGEGVYNCRCVAIYRVELRRSS